MSSTRSALRSREAWLELARDAGIWVNPCGSIHLAHRDDEWSVLEEFAHAAPGLGYSCELLTREAVLRRTAAANPDGLARRSVQFIRAGSQSSRGRPRVATMASKSIERPIRI